MLVWALFALFVVSFVMRLYAAKNNNAQLFRWGNWLSFGSCAVLTLVFLAQGIVFRSPFSFLIAAIWAWNAWNGYRILFR